MTQCFSLLIHNHRRYNNETFYMQLDAHHRFAEDWDVTVITKLNMLQRFSKKVSVRAGTLALILVLFSSFLLFNPRTPQPIISQYLGGFKSSMNKEELEEAFDRKPFRLTGKFFQEGERNLKRIEAQNMTAYVDFDPYPLKVRYGPVPVRRWNDHNLNGEYR